MKFPLFTMLIGLPGTGKSTWRTQNREPGEIVLSSDDHIEALCKKQGITYDQGFRMFADTAAKLVNTDFHNAIDYKQNIIDDRTNLTANSRKKKLSQLPQVYRKIAVVFKVEDHDEWLRRLDRPGKTIPEFVLNNMTKTYEAPSLEEGFDEIYVYDEENMTDFAISDK